MVIGALIPALQREHFRLFRAENFAQIHDIPGSMGFMDFAISPNINAATVFLLGIETKYQKRGFGWEVWRMQSGLVMSFR